MLEPLYGLFERFKKTWRMNYPADPPHWTQVDMPDLTGKVALVTGGSGGIGFEMCKALLTKGAKLYCVGRSGYKGQTALNELAAIGKGELKFIEIDLASLDTTRTAAQEFLSQETRLDILINNAGEFLPPIDKLTVDGYDLSFGVNCVATCFFTLCLLPRLLETPGSRIVHISSDAYRWVQRIDYESVFEGDKRRQMDPALIYSQSKLGIMLFSSELHRRYHRNGIVSVTVHPGYIKTNVWRHKPAWMAYLINLAMYPTHMGAITPLWAATSPEASDMGGRYAIPWARVGQAESWTEDPEQTKELWNWVINQTEKFNPSIARFRSE